MSSAANVNAASRPGGAGMNSADQLMMRVDTSLELSTIQLYAQIATLDFYNDIQEDYVLTEDGQKQQNPKAEKNLEELTPTYESHEEYMALYTPLFMEEVKSFLQRSKQSMVPRLEHAIQTEFNRPAEPGAFFHVHLERVNYKVQEKKYGSLKCSMGMGDLVLLSNIEDPFEKPPMHAICIVERVVGTRVELKTIVDRENTRSRLVAVATSRKHSGLKNKEEQGWYIGKIDNMSTVMREWLAMCRLKDCPLHDEVLRWNSMSLDKLKANICDKDARMQISAPLAQTLRAKYNDFQFAAIEECLKPQGITLIQGPPGTGKSTTILGIVSVLINSIARKKQGVHYKTSGSDKDLYLRENDETPERVARRARRAALRGNSERNMAIMMRHSPWSYQDSGVAALRCVEEGGSASGGRSSSPSRGASSKKATSAKKKAVRLSSPSNVATPFVSWTDAEPNCVSAGLKLHDYATIPAESCVEMSFVESGESNQFSKVLVCAPSNAAIDELVRRLINDGLTGSDGEPYKPIIVRLGPGVHHELKRYALEVQAQERAFARGINTTGQNKALLDPIKREIMMEANVICATLSYAGSKDIVNFGADFESVVVDEAAQATEPSVLIPLQTGCKRLVLVGDPQQLPATVFSKAAATRGYDKSLFQRLADESFPVQQLSVQYRMHPHISAFSSQEFYDGKLGDFRDRDEYEKAFPALWHELPVLPPLCFYHVDGQEEVVKHSYQNEVEATFVVELFKALAELYPGEGDWAQMVGVISPYDRQVQLIREKIKDLYNLKANDPCPVEVKTVDGFQGSEKEVIILSVVRGSRDNSIGFVRDRRRMNVALTRARRSLFVVGNAETLARNNLWEELMNRCMSMPDKRSYYDIPQGEERSFLVSKIRKFLRDQEKQGWLLNKRSIREANQLRQLGNVAATLAKKRKRDDDSDSDDDGGADGTKGVVQCQVKGVSWLENLDQPELDKDLEMEASETVYHLTENDIAALIVKAQAEEAAKESEEAAQMRQDAELKKQFGNGKVVGKSAVEVEDFEEGAVMEGIQELDAEVEGFGAKEEDD